MFFLYIKMVNNYYQKHEERLRKEAREKYQNFSEKENGKRQKKTRERCQNFTEGVSIIRNIRKSYLSIEIIII